MRVVNDRDEKTESQDLGFFSVAAHSILCAFGMSTGFFSPLPMIGAHMRLGDPWPKVAVLGGALIALSVIQVPVSAVVLLFVFGLYVSDAIWRETSFGRLFFGATLVAGSAAAAAFVVSAELSQSGLWQHWNFIVDSLISNLESLQKNLQVDVGFDSAKYKNEILYEGPFLYISAMLYSMWASLGLAAHLGWVPEGHPYSASSLRQLRFPVWVSLAFLATYLGGVFVAQEPIRHVCAGVSRLLGVLMFVQGCIYLSEMLARKMVRPRVRSLIYSISIVFGFYAVVGIGIVSPWFLRKQRMMEEVI